MSIYSDPKILALRSPAAAFIKNLNIYALEGGEVKSCLRAAM